MRFQLHASAFLRKILPGFLLLIAASLAFGQTPGIPPKPAGYFADEANVVDATTGHALNEQLAEFERDTSNQLLVIIYPSLPPDASPDQYSIDTFNSWHPGQKGKDNGAILFVYFRDHKMFIVTGRGLEGTLPDAICKNIIDQVITPKFRQSDYVGGIQAGVNAMIAATKGEYKGTGQTVQEHQDNSASPVGSHDQGTGGGLPVGVIIFFIALIILSSIFRSRFGGAPMIYTGGGFGGGGFGGFGGGGFSGGGGGGFSGFSGGGGSSAGGGAGGGW